MTALEDGSPHEDRAVVAIELRILDQTTGRVLVAASGRGDVLEQDVDAGVALEEIQIGSKGFARTPIGAALRHAVDDALLEMISRLPDIDRVGTIASVQGKRVFIDGGSDLNLEAGDVFQLLRAGEEVKNAKGEVIGVQESPLGRVEVLSVQAKMAVAKVTSIEEGEVPQAGDLIRLPDDS